MATMKDVAKLANVSVSTVSRVLSNALPVDAETRKRVELAVRSVGYRPNLVARGLRSKSSNLIGFVVPELSQESFAALIKYAESSAERHGFNLIIGDTHNDSDAEERFISNLIRRHVDAVIFSRVSDESRTFQIVRESGVPFVVIDRSMESEDIHTVGMDNYRAGELAARHLLELGHTRFACVTGPMNISIVRDRFQGYRDTIQSRGGTLLEKNVYEGDFEFESGLDAGRLFTRSRSQFTALWAHNDVMAIGAMNELRKGGVDVPSDISVMGLDNTMSSRMVVPSLTTIAQPFTEMCESALELILQMKQESRLAQHKVRHSPTLIVRDSTSRCCDQVRGKR